MAAVIPPARRVAAVIPAILPVIRQAARLVEDIVVVGDIRGGGRLELKGYNGEEVSEPIFNGKLRQVREKKTWIVNEIIPLISL